MAKELVVTNTIESRIFTVRGQKVMIDRDLAELYEVETKKLNQAVKRNIDRFPVEFMFKLTKDELSQLVTNCDRFNILKHSSSIPSAFTEHGIAMLSSVLKSKRACHGWKEFYHERHECIEGKKTIRGLICFFYILY